MFSPIHLQGKYTYAILGSTVTAPHLGAPTWMQSRISNVAYDFVTQNQGWNDAEYAAQQQLLPDR